MNEAKKADLTVSDLKSEIEILKKLKEDSDAAEAAFDIVKASYETQRTKILAFLQENELPNFKVPGVLNVSVVNEFYVAYPQTQEDIEKFNAWLEDTGRSHMRKLHSATLNSLFKEEMEKATENGEVVQIPGLGQPTTKQKLMVRKG